MSVNLMESGNTPIQTPWLEMRYKSYGNSEEDSSGTNFLVCMATLMFIFFLTEGLLERYKPAIGHQTGITIMFGIAFSLILWFTFGADEHIETFKFSEKVFFDFLLPPIIFNSGYNMRQKKFFQNLGNVSIFGIAVTFVCFTLYSLATFLLLKAEFFEMTKYYQGEDEESGYVPGTPYTKTVVISFLPMLLFTSLLCSSDVVAAVSIINYKEQPKLFSCIFGEGIFNDSVSIILFNAVSSVSEKPFTTATPFIILGQFVCLGFVSVGMGIIFGFSTALMFKHMRFLTHSPVMEMFMIFLISFVCYYLTSSIYIAGCEMSGIIALLTCAICDGHYTWHNFSQQGKTTTPVTAAFLGAMMESAIYAYVGIGLYALIPGWWSLSFIFTEFFIIVIFRIIGVIATFYAFRCCCKRKTIAFNELLFITYGGMIRGAIAFALVLKIPVEKSCPSDEAGCYTQDNKDLVVSTTLAVVMLTTLLFGTFMKPAQTFLVPPKKKDALKLDVDEKQAKWLLRSQSSAVDPQALADALKETEQDESGSERSTLINSEKERDHDDDHSELMLHPNQEVDVNTPPGETEISFEDEPASFSTGPFAKWFLSFDERRLLPFLIYNYDKTRLLVDLQYQEKLKTRMETSDKKVADIAHQIDESRATGFADQSRRGDTVKLMTETLLSEGN